MLTREQSEIRDLAREFAEREIRPRAAGWDEHRDLGREIFSMAAEVGFLGMLVPERYGGLDLDLGSYLAAIESLAWGDASLAHAVAVHAGMASTILLNHGDETIRNALLPRLASGEAIGAVALWRPGEGSDAGAIGPRAERADSGWRLVGRASWVPNGGRADLLLVFARTDEGDGVGVFAVRADEVGIVRTEATLGLRAMGTVGVDLDGIEIPEDRVVGDPTAGMAYAREALDLARLSMAALALGIAQAAYEHASGYSMEREQFGQALSRFDAIREKLATMATRLSGSRALLGEALSRFELDRDPSSSAFVPGSETASSLTAMAKLSSSETAVWVTDEAVQIFGGYGYMRDYPVERLMRDAKGAEIYVGTSTMMRAEIARGVIDAATP